MEKLILELQDIRLQKFKDYYKSKVNSTTNKVALSEAGLRHSKLNWIINQDKELKNFTDFYNHQTYKPYFINKNGDIYDNNLNGDKIKLKFKLPLNPKGDIFVNNKGQRDSKGNIKLRIKKLKSCS